MLSSQGFALQQLLGDDLVSEDVSVPRCSSTVYLSDRSFPSLSHISTVRICLLLVSVFTTPTASLLLFAIMPSFRPLHYLSIRFGFFIFRFSPHFLAYFFVFFNYLSLFFCYFAVIYLCHKVSGPHKVLMTASRIFI